MDQAGQHMNIDDIIDPVINFRASGTGALEIPIGQEGDKTSGVGVEDRGGSPLKGPMEGNSEDDASTDVLTTILKELTVQSSKLKNIIQYSFDTTGKYSRKTLYAVSVLFLLFAVCYSTLSTIIGVYDPTHIFEHLLLLKAVHVLIALPNQRTLPSMSSLTVYLVIGVMMVISMSSLYLFQGILSFPMQTLGESMNFLPIILFRPVINIPLRHKDLLYGVIAFISIIIYLIISETCFIGWVLLLVYIVFDAACNIFQSKTFTSDAYFVKLLYPSLVSSAIFAVLTLIVQQDAYIKYPLLTALNCMSSVGLHITNYILLGHVRGGAWMNFLNVTRQFVKLCYSFLIMRSLSVAQFVACTVVFYTLYLHGVSIKMPTEYSRPDSITYTS